MTNDLDYQLAPPTTIEGGYTPGCLSRSVNAANTVRDMLPLHGFEKTSAKTLASELATAIARLKEL